MEVWLGIGVGLLLMGGLGAWIADQKRREAPEGFLLGLLFGPLGVLIEALLPKGEASRPAAMAPDAAADRRAHIAMAAVVLLIVAGLAAIVVNSLGN